MKFLVAFILTCSFGASFANSLFDQVEDCGYSTNGNFDDLSIFGCRNAPCFFEQHEFYPFEIDFTTAQTSGVLHLVIDVIYGDFLPLSFNVMDVKAGEGLLGNSQYRLNYGLTIPSFFADQSFAVKFEIIDKTLNLGVICGGIEGHLF